MKIVRKLLTDAEVTPPGTRYDVDCNCIQRTVDGGDTWTDSPGDDPRLADGWRLPTRTSADPQCDAAANMVDLVHQTIDDAVSQASVWGAATSLLDLWLLAVGPVGWVVDLIVIACEAFFFIGLEAIDLTFTDAVYDDLLCIFFCGCDSTGKVDAASMAEILSAIDDLGDVIISGVMYAILNTWGPVGLSNAGAVGEEVGDCSACTACDETCHEYVHADDFYTESNDGVTLFDTYDSGIFEDDKTLVLTNVHAEWSQTGGTGFITNAGITVTVYSADVYPGGHAFTVLDTGGTPVIDIDTTGSGHVYRIVGTVFTAWSGGGPYSIWNDFRFDYEPVRSPFGWSTGTNCTP